ncbi:MAG: hypothetical protein ABI868_08325 [Acidobacteriota bacterium]
MTDLLTFVLCIENNAIRAQALLLCDSIRQFGGRHRRARILVVAPRPGHGVDRYTRQRLAALEADYVEAPLNVVCPEYGSANRVFTAAWAEEEIGSEWIAVLDSDTLFLGELDLPPDADVAVRPVDVKGSATAGSGDQFEDYWRRLADLQGIPLDRLPFVTTTVSDHRVRASYNGGLVVVRRQQGVLGAWADLFARSVAAGLKPWRGRDINVHASTGLVGREASEYWGSNQAALALAIWSRTARVVLYAPSHNVPLHLLPQRPQLIADLRRSPLVHVHYHWLFTDRYHRAALALIRHLGAEPDQVDWLAARLPIR